MLSKAKIKNLMKDRNVRTVRELSKKSHVPYSTLNRMIQGYDMHLSSIIELAKFLNVPVDNLINKGYSIYWYSDYEVIDTDTSNFYEVTLKMMLQSKKHNPFMLF